MSSLKKICYPLIQNLWRQTAPLGEIQVQRKGAACGRSMIRQRGEISASASWQHLKFPLIYTEDVYEFKSMTTMTTAVSTFGSFAKYFPLLFSLFPAVL